MADDLTPRPISHGPNALWEMRAEMERLTERAKQVEAERDNLAFEKREVARHLELVRMRLSAAEAEQDALKAARCPSCDHLPTGHQEDGCWYAVTTGTPGRDLVCPCTLPVAALDGQARATTDNRGDAVSAVIKPIIKRRNDAIIRADWEAARAPQHPSGPAWCAICDEPSPCQKARSDLRAALDHPTKETGGDGG